MWNPMTILMKSPCFLPMIILMESPCFLLPEIKGLLGKSIHSKQVMLLSIVAMLPQLSRYFSDTLILAILFNQTSDRSVGRDIDS